MMASFLISYIQHGILFLAFAGALILAAELIFPRERRMTPAELARAIGFNLVFIFLGGLLIYGWAMLFPLRLEPLIELPAPIAIVAAVLAADFAYYWMHRAQHSIPLLWRFHRVHHSVEKMGPAAGYHHFTQAIFDSLTFTLVASLFLPPQWAALFGLVIGLHGYYIHSTTALHFGPLNRFIHDNRSHRIHHSTEPRHFDKNFGIPTLIWDRVFGTAYHATPEEWPATGLRDRPENYNVLHFLTGR